MKINAIICVLFFSFFQTILLFGIEKESYSLEKKDKMINYVDFAHICIFVDNVEQAAEFYQKVFEAKLIDYFPNLKNIGYAKAAGFLDAPEKFEVSVKYLSISNLFIELHQIHSPKETIKKQTENSFVGAISFRVKNIGEAFEHIKKQDGIRLANESDEYKPFQLSPVTTNDFFFDDEQLEDNEAKKQEAAAKTSKIKCFSFFDKYGIQWFFVEHGS
jgi:maltose O-acetyltransferase